MSAAVLASFHTEQYRNERSGIMGQLDGRTALVTGATSGIGLAAARRLAQEGAYVFLTGRRQEALDDAVASIGDRATGVRADVADLDDLDRLFAAIQHRGPL